MKSRRRELNRNLKNVRNEIYGRHSDAWSDAERCKAYQQFPTFQSSDALLTPDCTLFERYTRLFGNH